MSIMYSIVTVQVYHVRIYSLIAEYTSIFHTIRLISFIYLFIYLFIYSCICLLSLLDFYSRATVVVQASVVRRPSSINSRFLGNCCMDPEQILWATPYPVYLQTFCSQNFQFANFCNFFFRFHEHGYYGSKNFKTLRILQFSSDLSQTLW